MLVRNSFCLVQPGSSVHLAAVLQACKGCLDFRPILSITADRLLFLQPVVA